jgi:tetratricopeptide (TPR) repeat protein
MEQVLEKCIDLDPALGTPTEDTIGAWGTLGDHYVGQERFDEAREVIWKVFEARLRRGQRDSFYLTLLLRLRFESAEPEIAINRLRTFLANDPQDYDSHRALGIYLTRIGSLAEARDHIAIAYAANPTVPRFAATWLWYLFHVNDVESVYDVMDHLSDEFDSLAEFWVYRGKAAEYRRDSAEAMRCFRRAVELEPNRIDANNLLAGALRRAGEKAEHAERLKTCQRLGAAYRDLAGIYAELRAQPNTAPTPEKCRDISALCQELGWTREADEWKQITHGALNR